MGSVLVAYSGGADSTFLLKVAKDVLGDQVLAVTAVSETYPASELVCARESARFIGAKHKVIRTRELKNPRFYVNPLDRCYFCKKELFVKLQALAGRRGLSFVADGSNADDLKDYRPGSRAKKECGVVSPLQEAGLTKKDVRAISKKYGLATWGKPAAACLASRIPYHSRITARRLARIDRAEKIIRKRFGILGNLRVRDYESWACVEVDKKEVRRLADIKGLENILRPLGYKKAVVDREGYRTGSMNPVRNLHKYY